MSPDSPTVSVVVPTYDRRETLGRAIDSVLAQTFEDFELLVVDDGSTDGTPELVRAYDDDRLRYLRSETNRGANAARNRGIRNARGEYVSFLDSDDEYPPDNLAAKVEVLADLPDDFAGVFTPHRTYYDGRLRMLHEPDRRVVGFEDVVRENPIGSFSCIAVRRSVFDRVGLLDEDLPAAQDYDFYLRALREYRMRLVDSTEVVRYLQEDSIGFSLERKAAAHEAILEKHGEYLTAGRVARQLFTLGVRYGRAGEWRAARRRFARALRADPTLVRAYPMLVLASLSGPLLPDVLSLAYAVDGWRNRAVRRLAAVVAGVRGDVDGGADER